MSSLCRTLLTMGHRDIIGFSFCLCLGRLILHPFNPSALGHYCPLGPIPIPVQNKPLHHRYHYIVQSLQHRPSIPVIIHYQPN
ncbi:unnamed protein product [Debaryomyces tyrocola]|nr:unnamed protein product [Debaryomyces tyrocola]